MEFKIKFPAMRALLSSVPLSVRWALTGAYAALIAFLCLAPSSRLHVPRFFEGEDKVAHFGMHAVYAALLVWSLNPRHAAALRCGKSRAAGVFLCTFGFGVAMEILQPILQPGDRTFSYLDMAANGAGALAALSVLYRLGHPRG